MKYIILLAFIALAYSAPADVEETAAEVVTNEPINISEFVPTTRRPQRVTTTPRAQYQQASGASAELKQRPVYRPSTNTNTETVVADVDEEIVKSHHHVKPTKQPHEIIEILESENQHKPDGSYNFHYRSADGTFREEKAVVVNEGTDESYLEVTGSYSFLDTDGNEVVVNYKADNHGFVPEGSNIHESIMQAAREGSDYAAKHQYDVDVHEE